MDAIIEAVEALLQITGDPMQQDVFEREVRLSMLFAALGSLGAEITLIGKEMQITLGGLTGSPSRVAIGAVFSWHDCAMKAKAPAGNP